MRPASLDVERNNGPGDPKEFHRSGWRRFVAAVPGIGASFLPVGACPVCWPAYAGFLGSLGVGFLLDGHYLFPLTLGLLAVALVSLAWRARFRRGYQPFWVGLLGAALILASKFLYSSDPVLYVGVGALLGASLWNAWARRVAAAPACAACAPASEPMNLRAHN